MQQRAFLPALGLAVSVCAPSLFAEDDLLTRFRSALRPQLQRLPDFTCQQQIQRARRPRPAAPFEPLDTIRVQVGVIHGREHYAWPGAQKFEHTELRQLVPTGTIGTGSFADHLQHIFLNSRTEFQAKGADPLGARFDFELAPEFSQYRVRATLSDVEAGVRGSVWLHPETLALVRLEVTADEISPDTGISKMHHWINFAPLALGEREAVLPVGAELTLTAANGSEEHRNTMEFSGCRQFVAESTLSFAGTAAEEPVAPAPAPAALPAPRPLPAGARVDLVLDSEIDPEKAVLGDPLVALIAKPVSHEQQIVVAPGTRVLGRLVRLEKETLPFLHYVIGLEFHTLEAAGQQVEFAATMYDAGPSSALLRPQKRFMPTFSKQRRNQLNILVREVSRGEGVLHWDARQPKIKRGLRMVWITGDLPALARSSQ